MNAFKRILVISGIIACAILGGGFLFTYALGDRTKLPKEIKNRFKDEYRYGKYLNYIRKSQFEIISSEGKPDSIYSIPNQGVEIDYVKTEHDDKIGLYKRETDYFFYYRPFTTELIDTCFDIEITEPKALTNGWIEYLDKEYTKEKIINGEDEEGSVGCEMEWRYSKRIGICLSLFDSLNMHIQLNVKRNYNEICH